jgi:hypothetical protein
MPFHTAPVLPLKTHTILVEGPMVMSVSLEITDTLFKIEIQASYSVLNVLNSYTNIDPEIIIIYICDE